MKNKINYWAVIVFYLIAIGCRYLTNKMGLINGIENQYLKSVLTGIGPTIGAVTVFITFAVKPIMNLKGNYRKIIMPMLLYWILPTALISFVAYYQKGIFPWLTVLTILVYGLLEEIGWRGFLYQQLKPLPLIANVFIVSILWFLWHLNFDITGSNLIFYGILVLGSWGIGKVADSTNSLLAVSAFHSLNNFFPAMGPTEMLIIGTLLITWIAILIIRKEQLKKRQLIAKVSMHPKDEQRNLS